MIRDNDNTIKESEHKDCEDCGKWGDEDCKGCETCDHEDYEYGDSYVDGECYITPITCENCGRKGSIRNWISDDGEVEWN